MVEELRTLLASESGNDGPLRSALQSRLLNSGERLGDSLLYGTTNYGSARRAYEQALLDWRRIHLLAGSGPGEARIRLKGALAAAMQNALPCAEEMLRLADQRAGKSSSASALADSVADRGANQQAYGSPQLLFLRDVVECLIALKNDSDPDGTRLFDTVQQGFVALSESSLMGRDELDIAFLAARELAKASGSDGGLHAEFRDRVRQFPSTTGSDLTLPVPLSAPPYETVQ
jgi:hypothetical protein